MLILQPFPLRKSTLKLYSILRTMSLICGRHEFNLMHASLLFVLYFMKTICRSNVLPLIINPCTEQLRLPPLIRNAAIPMASPFLNPDYLQLPASQA